MCITYEIQNLCEFNRKNRSMGKAYQYVASRLRKKFFN